MPEQLIITLPPGVTQEDFARSIGRFAMDREISKLVSKLLKKNPEYKALLKEHRQACVRRRATVDEASLLWQKIQGFRVEAHLEAEKIFNKEWEAQNATRNL